MSISKIDEVSETTVKNSQDGKNGSNAEQTPREQAENEASTQTEDDIVGQTDAQLAQQPDSDKQKAQPPKKKGPRSLTDPVIMENAYYICHDIADFLLYRGYKQGAPAK